MPRCGTNTSHAACVYVSILVCSCDPCTDDLITIDGETPIAKGRSLTRCAETRPVMGQASSETAVSTGPDADTVVRQTSSGTT